MNPGSDPGRVEWTYDRSTCSRAELIDAGLERLRSAIARAPAESAGALCTAIIEEVGTEQPDDIALLVVKG